ncbi:MAG: hypothetical protein U0Z17_08565 [Bacteroidales bacterium]
MQKSATRGAQMIRSENTFLNGYVIFDKNEGKAEVDVVQEAEKTLQQKISSGTLRLPDGVSFKFWGITKISYGQHSGWPS